jgi:SAM-dependent methyltransferase
MEPIVYEEMAQHEDAHWWFHARRRICQTVLDQAELPKNAEILEAGCGSGGNLSLLAHYGRVFAFEPYAEARAAAKSRGIGDIIEGGLPDNIPFADKQFDAVFMSDVLEHVKDDAASLAAVCARTKPGGTLVLTVPANRWLFSKHDITHHHFRRYGYHELQDKITAAGWTIELINYCNFWLFPAVFVVRLLEKFKKSDTPSAGTKRPSNPINTMLYHIFASERWLIPHIRLPFGVSLIVLARKPV